MLAKLIDLLSSGPISFSQLKKELQIKSNQVLIKYLKKVEQLARKKGWELIIIPARCKKCGYTFKKDIIYPSKCPKCKSEWIEEPKFYLRL